ITMRSEEFDTYLVLGVMQHGEMRELQRDDDSGGGEHGTDSRLRITLPEDGEYIIRAEAMDGDMRGAFTLTLEQLPPSVLPTPRPIERGRTVNGELRERDPELDDGQYYHLWSLSAQAGERIRISMQSEAFDTYVALGRLAGSEFVEIAATDDGGEGTNSLLEVTVEEMGIYVIRATTFFAGVPGPYTLRVDRIP
ncbi:MAG: peptidase, partial [Longimicrobiaceae bacterium]